MNYLKNELIERINFYKGWIAEAKNLQKSDAEISKLEADLFFLGVKAG